MKTAVLSIVDGHTFDVAKDKDKRLVGIPEIEKLLGWRSDSGREKMRSKSLKAFAGKALTLVKKQHKQGGTMNYITTEDLNQRLSIRRR